VCQHQPPCPTAAAPEEPAHLVVHYPEQGWALRSDGVVLFEDTGELLPDGQVIHPHRPLYADRPAPAASTRSAA
jgi:hypothetical protein